MRFTGRKELTWSKCVFNEFAVIPLAIVLFWLLAGIAAVQVVMSLGFAFVLALAKSKPSPPGQCPKAAVVLSLRGADPSLQACIRGLLNQDYPDFEVRIVVDDDRDPAWDILQRAVDERCASRVVATRLQRAGKRCGLKCSSVVQAIRELDASFEVIALLDTDTAPHRTWLRELVAPLADPKVGMATGSRWYMPDKPNLGSLVRYAWNAAAVVQMYWFEIAWGGTLALKRSAIERADLLAHWERAFCEDTMLFEMLKKHGLRQVFVPTLMMVNRESCTISDFCTWMPRQLLTVRLYHPGWRATVAHGFMFSFVPLLTLGVLLAAVVRQEYASVAWSLAGLFLLGLVWLPLIPCEWALRRVVGQRDEYTRWLTPAAVVMLPFAMVITVLVYPATLLKAMFTRKVEWRGARYRIDGPWQIHLDEHPPFRDKQSTGKGHSL